MVGRMRHAHRWLVIAALAATGIAGAAGCGRLDGSAGRADRVTDGSADSADESTVDATDAFGAEAPALAAMGFDLADYAPLTEEAAADPAPSASPSSGPGAGSGAQKHNAGPRKRQSFRVLLRKNTLHGEAVVKSKDGTTKTVVVQRGTVTAVTDKSITVKSSDGYTLTWSLSDQLRVIEHRGTLKASDLAAGTEVGVAGAKEGSATTARLVLIPRKK